MSNSAVRVALCALLCLHGARATADDLASNPGRLEKKGDTILLDGPIDNSLRDKFRESLDSQTTTVILHSGGGESAPAMDIGRAIRQRNLRVVVIGICASACADFIFLAATHRFIRPDSLVVFHNTASSFVKMAKNSGGDIEDHSYVQTSMLEKSFFREEGIPEFMLYEPLLEMQTTCYDKKGTGLFKSV